ncbi:MAG TPA: helix-turn-helix domain-containing protein [Rubricoccaceae bacterium]|jgi:transcriptional regulator with XRE-family HTH domain
MDWPPDRIRTLRKRTGLDQAPFARQLGFGSGSRVSELEREDGAVPPSKPVQIILAHIDAHGPLPVEALPSRRAEAG